MTDENTDDRPQEHSTADETNETDPVSDTEIDWNSAEEEPKYPNPPHEAQTDENGEPDYEATIDEMGLEYDEVIRIGNDFYRYRGNRTDDIVLAPLSTYSEVKEDSFTIEYVWEAYQNGNLKHETTPAETGMISAIEDEPGISKVHIEPDSAADSNVYFDVEGVPELAGFYLDYFHGNEYPMIYLHDADCDEVAFIVLLPNADTDKARIIRDRSGYYPNHMPDPVRDRIVGDSE